MSLTDWRRSKLSQHHIVELFYFSMIDNLESLLQYGILPKNEMIKRGLSHASFAEESVQDRRHIREIELSNHTKATIHDLVPLYLVPRTPTLSARRAYQNKIFFIVINSDIVADEKTEFSFSDGNAASQETRFFNSLYKLKHLPWDVLKADYWNDFSDGKRKRNAEFLIFPSVPPKYFIRIIILNSNLQNHCKMLVQKFGSSIDVIVDSSYFFI
jgi:hypothetical protein